MGARLRRGRWGAQGWWHQVRRECVGRAGGRCRKLGARARGAVGVRACGAGRRAGGALGVSVLGVGRGRTGRGVRCLGVLVRMVSMLAGSVGPVWVLVNLAQF